MQVRWGALLAKLLRTYRTRITLSIPWRPLFETLRAKFVEGLDTYSGALPHEAMGPILPYTTLVRASSIYSLSALG